MAPLRVLLVVKSHSDVPLLIRELERLGRPIEPTRVEAPEAMRAALSDATWDLVLADWSLARFSGPAALALLAEQQCDLPCIIVDRDSDEEQVVAAMRAGARDFVSTERLARLIPAAERALRERAGRESRRAAETARREAEHRMDLIAESGLIGLVVADGQGTFIEANTAFLDLVGYTRDDLAAGRISSGILTPTDWRDADTAAIARLRAGQGRELREKQYLRKDGTLVTVLVGGAMLDATRGLGVIVDVSARQRAEESLRVSEARLRRLWDSGLILIAISDSNGVIRDINVAGAAMLGYTREELLTGRIRWHELTPPEWRAADARALAELARHGVSSPYEKQLIRKDGKRATIYAGAASQEGAERIAIAIDVTERKRVEADLLEHLRIEALTAEVGFALAQAHELPEILRPCAEAMLLHLDAALVRIWTLDASKQMLDLQAGAGTFPDVEEPYARVSIGTSIIGLVAQERRSYVTNDVAHDAGFGDAEWPRRERMVAFAGHPLVVGGELVGVVALFARHPLTEAVRSELATLADTIAVGIRRKSAEQARGALEVQLRQTQKMEAVGRLAGGIAHDFNNLLSVVLCYAELILADLPASDPLQEDIRQILVAAQRASELTRQLLMFSRQQVLAPRVLDLNDVLAGMATMLRRLVGEDVELTFLPRATKARVRVDLGSIEQVMMNLVVNARDAMPRGGRLTLETADAVIDAEYVQSHLGAKPGAYVVLAVTDTGTGMDEATKARIFEPFFTTKPVGSGTGLGLSTVFGIAQQSDGNVWVYSELGVGTTVKLYLPQVDAVAETVRAQSEAKTLQGTETILLVEDEAQVRAVALGILRRHGYTVLEAQGASHALEFGGSYPGRIDLLLTDVVMPQMSGPELARRITLMRPTIKVICMSGYTDDTAVRHGVVDAELAYLQKPITTGSLTRKVREVLQSGSLR